VRVFVVASFTEGASAGEILAKPTRLRWHPPQSGEEGQETTGEVEGSSRSGSTERVYIKSKRAQNVDDYETWVSDVPAPTLNTIDNTCDAFATVAIAYDGYNNKVSSTVHTTLRTGKDSGDGIFIPVDKSYKVRRLTPVECERLMGWPDNHTKYDKDDNELSDSARYKMCGNGIAAPVAQWLCENIVQELT
jgi:DNA (cytosine-5)-methyltransferase 1